MTPGESIIKNLMLLGIVFFIYRFHPVGSFRYARYATILSVIFSLTAPFVLNPVDMMAANHREPEATNFPFDLPLIQGNSDTVNLPADLSKGKHIIAFLSMSCSHCKSLAFKMHVIEKRHPEIPFFLILNGKEDRLQSFYGETKADNMPYIILHGMPFAKITGGVVPTVYWIDDGVVVKKSLYISLEETEILKWLGS
jgi:hypothetical protein